MQKSMTNDGVYLDYNSTTPIDPRVRAVMEPWLGNGFGNASSRDHRWGWDAAAAVEEARDAVAEAVRVPPTAIVFTSGATEALNAVIRSYVGFAGWEAKKIIVCTTEHEAVLGPSRYVSVQTGVPLETLGVDSCGGLDPDCVGAAVAHARGALVAIMAANNEIGTVHSIRRIAERVHAAGGRLLCDATQAFGRIELDVDEDGIDFAVVSAHKMYGPKGSGAMLARDPKLARQIEPLLLGGGQERGLRGGTLNVAGIVGMGAACRFANQGRAEEVDRMRQLRDRLEDGILSQVGDAWVNADRAVRLCNTSSIGFKRVDARALIRDMHDVAVSTRSACSSGNSGPSHVLKAIGLSDEDAYSCVRFSGGRFTTQEEIDYVIEKVVTSVDKLRRRKSVRA